MVLVLTTYFLIALLTVTLYNFFFADRLEDLEVVPGTGAEPRVSVLISASNDRENLAQNLPAFLKSDHTNLEVLVLIDDASTDGSRDVVRELAAQNPGKLRLLDGKALPEGWLRKNWALHQLSGEAQGELLIFTDATVRCSPKAVSRTVAWMESQRLACLTAWPHQVMETWSEKAVLPIVTQFAIFALIPLRKVMTFPSTGFLVANGQWLTVKKDAYQLVGGHEAIRDRALEDLELARRIKARAELRVLPVLAVNDLSSRMYRGLDELQEGFKKDLYVRIGATETKVAAFMVVVSLALVVPWAWVLIGDSRWIAPLALLAALRALQTRAFRSSWDSFALHPAGSLLLLKLMFDSYQGHGKR